MATPSAVRRLNWGCGSHTGPGWINADRVDGPQVDLACDIRVGLPIESNTVDYAVSVHALQELAYDEVVPALMELRRVLRPGGVLRLVLPDLTKGIRAYVLGKPDYFKVDEAELESPGGRFVAHMLWYGHSRMLFTPDFAEELLLKAQFVDVAHCEFRRTASRFPEIAELDNRESESMYVEATKPTDASSEDATVGSAPPERTQLERVEPALVTRPAASEEPAPKKARRPEHRIEVTDVALAADEQERLLGFRLRKPRTGLLESRRLPIVGWVVGRRSRATYIEVVHGDDPVARAPVEGERPSVARRFQRVPQAQRPGFKLKVAAAGSGESELRINAVLEDGTRVPMATISMRVQAGGTGAGHRKPSPSPDSR